MPQSPTASQPPHRVFDFSAWLPSRRALLWILGAFALGLVLFLLVWRGGGDDFYRAGPAAPTAAAPEYAPLPAPIAGGTDEVSDIAAPAKPNNGEAQPRLVETAPPPPPSAAAPVARPASPATASQPQPISMPPPKYPTRALRNGEQGTVMVSAEVGADGLPTAVEVARSSGSRDLDRAAVDAVKHWRFTPGWGEGRARGGRVRGPFIYKI